jgi:hypothetical protein
MKIDFKKLIFLGLVASVGSVFAQETTSDSSKEVSMSTTNVRAPSPDECRGEKLELDCQRRVDDYDYDVYTVGSGEEESERPCNYRKNCDNEPRKCGNDCKRKGAAKAAQE